MVRTHLRYLFGDSFHYPRNGGIKIPKTSGFLYILILHMKIKKDVSLHKMNTMGIRTTASHFVVVNNVKEIKQAVSFANSNDLEWLVVGEGSNICFEDNKIKKLIIKINITGVEVLEDAVVVGAGEDWDLFVSQAIKYSVPYIENLSGIPGTVGASPIQNIGAYGIELKDIIRWVEVYDCDVNETKKLGKDDCQFAYRDSIFKKPEGCKYIVTKVAFNRTKDPDVCLSYKDLEIYFSGRMPNKEEVRKAVLEIRSGKFPDISKYGTAGSFFKNPIVSIKEYKKLKDKFPSLPSYDISEDKRKIPLAWILDNVCDLKGYRDGNVWLHEYQPLVLVTNKSVTGKEIRKFSDKVKKIVFEKTGIEIENEVVSEK